MMVAMGASTGGERVSQCGPAACDGRASQVATFTPRLASNGLAGVTRRARDKRAGAKRSHGWSGTVRAQHVAGERDVAVGATAGFELGGAREAAGPQLSLGPSPGRCRRGALAAYVPPAA